MEDDFCQRVRLESKRCDNAEVSAASAERPEQVGVIVSGRCDGASIGENNVGREEIVTTQSILAAERSFTAAKRESTDADGIATTEYHCEADVLGR